MRVRLGKTMMRRLDPVQLGQRRCFVPVTVVNTVCLLDEISDPNFGPVSCFWDLLDGKNEEEIYSTEENSLTETRIVSFC
jgi:hypothetical protein